MAAGSGQRLRAGGAKAFVEAAGRPLLAWSLLAFGRSRRVGSAVVAVPAGAEEKARALAGELHADLELRVVSGGEQRSDSVRAGLAAAPEAAIVAVHDAARPLVTAALIDGLIAALEDRPATAGVIAAAPIADTVKRAAEAHGSGGPAAIAATEERSRLWAAQTPQVFRASALRAAHAAAGEGDTATDDAVLVERQGGTVLLHAVAEPNLKVTTPADLAVAELLLEHVR